MSSFWAIFIVALMAIGYAIKILVSDDEEKQSSKSTVGPSSISNLTQNNSPKDALSRKNGMSTVLKTGSINPVFHRDKFLLKQKHLTISEKYYVYDENMESLIFIERPAHSFRNFLAGFGAVFVALICIVFVAVVLTGDNNTGKINLPLLSISILVMFIFPIITFAFLSKIRHIKFYRDDSRSEQLLEIKQDFKYRPLHMSYTVLDTQGTMIARLRKDYIHNILRKKWVCKTDDETVLCTILEDSIMRSLLRRVLGPLFGALRTNFIIQDFTSQNIIGEFNRKFTLTDQYVLDMSKDQGRILDRRVALAIGVLLDTGEKR